MRRPRFWKRTKVSFHNSRELLPIQIVSDAIISLPGIVGGLFVPLVIIDTSQRPDLEEYIRVHMSYGAGDVVSTWGLGKNSRTVALRLEFKRPLDITALFFLDVYRNTALISFILSAGAFYIQSGRPGDVLSKDVHKPKVLIEVPDTGFRAHWEKERHALLVKRYRYQGLTRSQARNAANESLAKLRVMEKALPNQAQQPDAGTE